MEIPPFLDTPTIIPHDIPMNFHIPNPIPTKISSKSMDISISYTWANSNIDLMISRTNYYYYNI